MTDKPTTCSKGTVKRRLQKLWIHIDIGEPEVESIEGDIAFRKGMEQNKKIRMSDAKILK